MSTLKIEVPHDYDQARVGALVLTYLLLVVTPLLRLLKEVLPSRSDR